MSSDAFQPPFLLKGEDMDAEFTLDTDHRKRRRNRTTQSCLNCHTSKRRCDRKRPCQRCIQLGLTGLCVYEVDDISTRDDPTVDENTRLRNRIAELERLVRELRGKPHPRWADPNYGDGDPSERWHSRATKSTPQIRQIPRSPVREEDGRFAGPSSTHVKSESSSDPGNSRLYQFTPSPRIAHYEDYQSSNPSPPLSSYDGGHPTSYQSIPSGSRSGNPYPTQSPTMPGTTYSSGNHPYTQTVGGYRSVERIQLDDKVNTSHYASASHSSRSPCGCRTNPGTSNALIALTHQLQSTLNTMRHYTPHSPHTSCTLYRRIADILSRTSGNEPNESPGPYGALPTPTGSDVVAPLSASSTPYNTPSSAVSHEWSAIAGAGYNPYFPPQHGDGHNMYNTIP
ncbi:hypothetical protein PLICRDRAFT_39249 [Plicaturopsis crispa FD-325 SS-3]|nr:hypothetical protein PLICRDRAFT_39249 [Plicaturopsis crispa FD-325 SS-3]